MLALQDLFLETHGVKLGFMSAFVKAAADALLKVGALLVAPVACCVMTRLTLLIFISSQHHFRCIKMASVQLGSTMIAAMCFTQLPVVPEALNRHTALGNCLALAPLIALTEGYSCWTPGLLGTKLQGTFECYTVHTARAGAGGERGDRWGRDHIPGLHRH